MRSYVYMLKVVVELDFIKDCIIMNCVLDVVWFDAVPPLCEPEIRVQVNMQSWSVP